MAAPWRDIVLQLGYNASAAFPIILDGKPAGVLCVHAAQTHYFNDEEVRLLDEMAVNIALALRQMEFEMIRQETERSKAYLAAMVESSNDAIISKNLDGIITSWNAGAERIFGYTAAEIVDQPSTTLIPADRIAEEATILARLRRGERIEPFETLRRHKDGRQIDVSITVSPIKDGAGMIIGASKIARDITALKTAQQDLLQRSEELQRSNEDLEQFAYVASHDLQEPLRAVAGCVQLLSKRYRGQIDARADEFITHAVDGAERMQTLINDLLQYSRVGTRGNEFRPVELARALQAALKNLENSIAESQAVITHDSLPVISADLTQMTLLFQNLIGNALKFRKPDVQPCIHVASERRGSEWVISVRDNGIGMSSEYFDRVFGVFQRLHTRAEYPGTGIGLALCKRIVERHGGKIWITSEPGAGSTFFCSFQAAQPDADENTDAPEKVFHV
jgi:PAS domain S-box-containing protein